MRYTDKVEIIAASCDYIDVSGHYKKRAMSYLDKTIKQLTGLDLSSDSWNSGLIRKVEKYINQPLKSLDIEALRLLISQNIGLDFLIPMAIDRLRENILAKGDLYEGDLLKNVLDSNKVYWIKHKDYHVNLVDLYNENLAIFESDNSYKQIRKSFELFKGIVCVT